MIANFKSFVYKNHQRSSLLLSALGWTGQGRLKNIMPVRRKNFGTKPKQTGKSWGSARGKIFARLPWENVSAIPASVGRKAKQKNFRFLN